MNKVVLISAIKGILVPGHIKKTAHPHLPPVIGRIRILQLVIHVNSVGWEAIVKGAGIDSLGLRESPQPSPTLKHVCAPVLFASGAHAPFPSYVTGSNLEGQNLYFHIVIIPPVYEETKLTIVKVNKLYSSREYESKVLSLRKGVTSGLACSCNENPTLISACHVWPHLSFSKCKVKLGWWLGSCHVWMRHMLYLFLKKKKVPLLNSFVTCSHKAAKSVFRCVMHVEFERAISSWVMG